MHAGADARLASFLFSAHVISSSGQVKDHVVAAVIGRGIGSLPCILIRGRDLSARHNRARAICDHAADFAEHLTLAETELPNQKRGTQKQRHYDTVSRKVFKHGDYPVTLND